MLKNMCTRLNYRGGHNQIDRMNKDKAYSLKKALSASYQSATAILSDGREFKCLINPNKLSLELDDKIISIPFRDYCLNNAFPKSIHNICSKEGFWEDMEDPIASLIFVDTRSEHWGNLDDIENECNCKEEECDDNRKEEQDIAIKEGDVITWKENGSKWLVHLRYLEETAYFRANIRRCRHQLILGNGSKYWAYVRGPVEQSIVWSQKSGNYFNKLNYSLVMYITQNPETLEYFHRFKKIKINNQSWEVQAVDSISTPGILEIALKETFNNIMEENLDKAVENATQTDEPKDQDTIYPYIKGLTETYPYDIIHYEIKNYNGEGTWKIIKESRQKLVKIKNTNKESIDIFVMTGKSGSFTLGYENEKGRIIAILEVQIKSL